MFFLQLGRFDRTALGLRPLGSHGVRRKSSLQVNARECGSLNIKCYPAPLLVWVISTLLGDLHARVAILTLVVCVRVFRSFLVFR